MTIHPAVAQFRDIRDAVNAEFVDREQEIDAVALALIARHHVFFLGEPGVAKSELLMRFTDRIEGATRFEGQFSRFMEPSELFGPLSVKGLRDDRRTHSSPGFLQDAHVFVAEEIWDGNEPILRKLLMAINERTWRDDGQLKRLPLSTMVASSNFCPDENHENFNGLAAVFDRILIRRHVRATYDKATLDAIWDLERGDAQPLITWDEVVDAQEAALKVPVSQKARDAVEEIVTKLRKEGITISPRRFRQTKVLLQARAWLDGQDEAGLAQVEGLADCFWQKPDQIALVERTVMMAASPDYKKIVGLSDRVTTLVEESDQLGTMASDDPRVTPLSVSLVTKLKAEAHQLVNLGALTGRAQSLGKDTMRRLEALHDKVFEIGYGLDADVRPSLAAVLESERKKGIS